MMEYCPAHGPRALQEESLSLSRAIHHYFVDESGDLVLFGRRGKVLVGHAGCSNCFMIGVAHLPAPEHADEVLTNLRRELRGDPYFKGVPSMQPEEKKTALYFHAKNDLPEVRREVFKVLPALGAKVQVAIRPKADLVGLAKRLHSAGERLTENQVYDDMIARLFRNLLHKADENKIVFAKRGKIARYEALAAAIGKAKQNFEKKWGRPSGKPTSIRSLHAWSCAGLQVIDYDLWALQRLYERGEDRYFELLRPGYRLIMDLDDTRNRAYGEWYSDRNRLDITRIKAF